MTILGPVLITLSYIFMATLVSYGYYTYKITSGKWVLYPYGGQAESTTSDSQDLILAIVAVLWPIAPFIPLLVWLGKFLWKGLYTAANLIVKGLIGIYALERWFIKEVVAPKTNSVLPKLQEEPELVEETVEAEIQEEAPKDELEFINEMKTSTTCTMTKSFRDG